MTRSHSRDVKALRAKVDAAIAAGQPVTMTEAEINLFVRIVVDAQRRDRAVLELADEVADNATSINRYSSDGDFQRVYDAIDAYQKARA